MPDTKKALAALEQKLESSRRERNVKLAQEMLGHDPKKLAQEMLGRNRRTSTPKPAGSQNTLASRMGVTKRSASLPRLNSTSALPPRAPRQPSALGRSRTTDALPQTRHERAIARPPVPPKIAELNIRGAAGGPYIVIAQNFAPGTTAADIESVLQNVGGEVTHCYLVSSYPTVIAEIGFVEKAGADKVIGTFNNKRADGRLLHVYYQKEGGAAVSNSEPNNSHHDGQQDSMEVDTNAESREEQNRLREQRRGRETLVPREPMADRAAANDRYAEDSYQPAGQENARQNARRPRNDRQGGNPRFGGRMYSDGHRGGRY